MSFYLMIGNLHLEATLMHGRTVFVDNLVATVLSAFISCYIV